MGLGRWYKRWRHGRGFGVHSPLAYALVTEVLRKQRCYAYHAEQYPSLGGGVLCRARARMLVRLAAFADARAADVSHIDDPCVRRTVIDVLRAYSPDIRFSAGGADIVVTDSASAYDIPRPGDKVVLLVSLGLGETPKRQSMDKALSEVKKGAITIDNARDTAVTVLRQDLPRQTIEAAF